MSPRPVLSHALSTLVFAAALHFGPDAHAANLDQEYEQVRRIALRDPRVRDAYARADERLSEKIVALDPALAHYRPGRSEPPAHADSAKPRLKAAAPAPRIAAGARAHTVAPGETLGGIAAKYHVSTARLKSLNHIADERKLRAGQTLAIPGESAPTASPTLGHSAGFWSGKKRGT